MATVGAVLVLYVLSAAPVRMYCLSELEKKRISRGVVGKVEYFYLPVERLESRVPALSIAYYKFWAYVFLYA